MGKQIEGIFLSFTPGQSDFLSKRLPALGYDYDIDGVKSFLLDCARSRKKGTDSRSRINRLLDDMESKMRENPQEALNTINNIFDGISSAIDRYSKRKNPRT